MPESLQQMRTQLNEYFQSLEKKQKIKMLVSTILVLVSLTILILVFMNPRYVVLHSNLSPQESGEIKSILESNNVKVRFGDTSSVLKVPRNDLERAQVLVATQGISTDFISEDLFEGSSFMQTSEDRARDSRIKKQNYLRSTIEQIPGIENAVVNLSTPERTGFIMSDNEDAKASVYLSLGRGSNIDPQSVDGITRLVANAVPGLDPENVTIHGTDGRVLNANLNGTNKLPGSNEQFSLQQTVKDDLENSITEFLATVYGYGNVVVTANVTLDFDSQVTEITEFSPPIEGETEGIVRSMQSLEQNVLDAGAAGVPGTDPNTDDIPQYIEMDEYGSVYSEASKTINYEIDEIRQKIVKAQGQIQDVTVAVYVNSDALAEGDLSDTERSELVSMISAAAGLETRVVELGVRPFNTSLEDQWKEAIDSTLSRPDGSNIPLWSLPILAVLVLGILYFGFNSITKRNRNVKSIDEELPEQKQVIEDIDLELTGSEVKQQVEKLVNKKPDAVAQLLRNWLSED
ncbi:flagellar basal-body MS-ring/collar protein FliF [Serpentinicella sp. ANB-PHB4]|uniref:flagellar basal-body MS-ring/collar protein FliF n=1 Tax=Serpentinicella sp. ANB-PHB4 TaxID=3074076 RepID=UPI002856719F|nr:flagellar basal-body MS-ring/collar protein FliF [Serpentinicella sp. ANB-PHB4]MDR5658272.1 flagellar basal-body MS-ring/collar protein FliF [Serpentinicella sp. ANB-PHB4]